jgi:hypothetical protein
MKCVRLATFEAIQTNKQSGRLEDGGLRHPVGTPLGVLSGSDYERVLHERPFLLLSLRELGTSFEATKGPAVRRPS